MINQFKVLCRVKELHEERKLRALRAKRAEVEEARQKEDQQREVVRESKESLPSREKALFDKIMQKVVDLTDINATKDAVLNLQVEHQKLEDELERVIQVKLRLEGELEEARRAYQMAQRNLDKFNTMKSDLEREALHAAEVAEENEIEDLFSKGQALPA